jgi:hypothetical protein
MIRQDISNTLIHLTRDLDGLTAENVFRKIIKEKSLKGSSINIRGKHNCICFSETPISAIGQILAQKIGDFHYSPFGFMFSKKQLFDLGARPVIYQPESDFELLPEKLQFRHVRFEINSKDWTWEREWRLNTNELKLSPETVTLIVPQRRIIDQMKEEIAQHNFAVSIALEGIPVGHRKLEWHFIALENLGY